MPYHHQIRGSGCVESAAGPTLHLKYNVFHLDVAGLDDGKLAVPDSRIT